ncbi:hypothetical protein Vafri_18815 [Volvox africanus]|uniref:Apple domain-containing protein n=1 Tax=Volvox africanus TaxID=51714 RepID=A0A8J4BT93_9CHLO|nr:hypothetical protein Vafri_18815 [Volvox africanus]
MATAIFSHPPFSSNFTAINVMDGVIPDYGSSSSTYISGASSSITNKPFICMDFGEAMTISRIVLYNRRDCCGDLLTSAVFRLGGAIANVTGGDTLNALANRIIYSIPDSASVTSSVVIAELNPPPTGRYLVLRNSDNSSTGRTLGIAEIEVYGTSAVCTLQLVYGAGYGNDSAVISNQTLPDEAACCQACYINIECMYWDYVLSSGICRLKIDQKDYIRPGQILPGFYLNSDRVAGAKKSEFD